MSSKPTSAQILLEVKNLYVHYGKLLALNDVFMTIPEGEIVSLIGANGAGKSTILKVISGLMKPTRGVILYQGRGINGLPPHKITQLGIAYVPEGRRLFNKMTVMENLLMGRYTKKNGQHLKEALDRAFRYFPVLKERIKQKAATLSGGEAQMLAIARGLMVEPKLMLFDEPSIGLSPIMTAQIGEVISEINKEGTTVILAEQNARLALKLSHQAYVFETGNLILHGKTDQLIHNKEIIKAYLSA